MAKILLIDDDQELAMITKDMLEDYNYEVTIATNAENGFQCLTDTIYDLILLDINLPECTGFEVCRELRKLSSVPIIFASARTSEDDRITGLDIGGDDYLAKPYSLKELLSRVNALMRRTYGFVKEQPVYQLGEGSTEEITIDISARTVKRGVKQVNLSLKEFDLLACLAKHMGEAMSKEVLLREVWGTFSEVEMSTLTVHIRWLREKLEENPSKPIYIQTVWGVGYILTNREETQ